jgi:hypothetical protein
MNVSRCNESGSIGGGDKMVLKQVIRSCIQMSGKVAQEITQS